MTDLTATSPHSCARPEASTQMPAALAHRVEQGAVGLLDQPAPRDCICAVDETRCGSLTTPPTSVQQPAGAGPIHSSVTASNPHTQHHSSAPARCEVFCGHNKAPGCSIAHQSPIDADYDGS